MTMHPVSHPDDERLSAFAADDDGARADAALRAHIDGCERCGSLVNDLGQLRSRLAAMPDLAPPRPIRIVLPPRSAQGGFAQLVRRLFGPAIAAGATLAVVGAVGLGAVGTGGAGSTLTVDAPAAEEGGAALEGAAAPSAGAGEAEPGSGAGSTAATDDMSRAAITPEPEASVAPLGADSDPGATTFDDGARAGAEGPTPTPWLPLLLGGIGLVGAALFLRFAVVPRAG